MCWRCDGCRYKATAINEWRWFCRNCDVDYCQKCKPREEQAASQLSQGSIRDPSQLYANTPDSFGASQLSQGSLRASQFYPATPDSFEDGSQLSLRREFGTAMTITSPAADELTPPEEAMYVATALQAHQSSTTIATPMQQPFFLPVGAPASPSPMYVNVPLLAGSLAPGTPPRGTIAAQPNPWSVHGLFRPASLIAKTSPERNKRGAQAVAQKPAEKRPRPAAPDVMYATLGTLPPSHRAAGLNSSCAPHASEPVESQLPEVSEEDRVRRLQKRQNGVTAVKSSPEYAFLVDLAERGSAVGPPPPAHDPADPNVSKRTWEKGMETWRHQMRSLASANGFCPPQSAPA